MYPNKLLYASALLVLEGFLILLFAGAKTSGKAYSFGLPASTISNVTIILGGVFVTTLITIIIYLKFLRHVDDTHIVDKDPRESKLSMAYMIESLEKKKPKKEIRKDLERKGFKKEEIDDFLGEWEEEEDIVEEEERNLGKER